jgi:hypothetical protein
LVKIVILDFFLNNVTFSKQNIGYFIFLGMYIDVQTTYNQASNLTYAHLLSVPLTTLRLFFVVQIICFNFSFNLATGNSYWKCTSYYYFADLSRTCMQINKKWGIWLKQKDAGSVLDGICLHKRMASVLDGLISWQQKRY